MFKSLFIPIAAVAAFIVLVGLLSQGKFNSILPKVNNSATHNTKVVKINNTEIKVEVAKTNEERAKGLSNRDKLDEMSGMVFVFSKNSNPIFWMKDTKIPLDFVWISGDKIVGIEKNVQPEAGKSDSQLKRYPAPKPVDYVLEVNGGFCDKNNITTGQTLSGLEQL
jgi:uncharacterized membrane protein (UPF0127 family)